jgi:hypothetical protein
MANKKLAELNKRWLLKVNSTIADLQSKTIEQIAGCDKESPNADWNMLASYVDSLRVAVESGRANARHAGGE